MRHEIQSNLRETYTYELMKSSTNVWASFFEKAHEAAASLNKKHMSISSVEGRLLKTIIALHGCKKFVEVGTLTGYSALWISQGMGSGSKLYTLELDAIHAQKAQEVFTGLPAAHSIELVEGDARVTLQNLKTKGPFDGIFIDANKPAYGDYLTWADENLKSGGIIIADNIYLNGAVYDSNVSTQFGEKQLNQMREFNKKLSSEEFYTSCILPTSDGMFLAIKK